jgi:hypothetical protein
MDLWTVEESEDTRFSKLVVQWTQGRGDFGAGRLIDKLRAILGMKLCGGCEGVSGLVYGDKIRRSVRGRRMDL